MTQVVNQFAISQEKGAMDLRFNPNVVSAQIDSAEAATLVPGQGVKMVDSANGVPKLIKCALNTDDVFGVLPFDQRRSSFVALDYVEVAAMRGNVIVMEASAAIARWARVMLVISGSKVVTASGTGTVIGRAYDKAAGSGSLIRVMLDLPGESYAESAFAQAANVAAVLGTLTGTVTGTIVNVAAAACAGGSTPTAAQVDTAVAALALSTNLALKELQTVLNAEIAALKTANLQASA